MRVSSVAEVGLGKALLLGELEGVVADQEHMPGLLHDRAGDGGRVHDVAQGGDAGPAVGRSVHDGGVELDDAVFVGVPPRPTEWSLGSASTIATPAIAASSGSAPFLIISMAISTVLRLPLAITTGRLAPVGFGSAAPMASVLKLRPVNAVVPMKCRRFSLGCMEQCPWLG